MQDKKYLLSLKEVWSEKLEKEDPKWEAFYAKVCGLLDAERRKKLEHIKRGRKLIESIGAGLLLQLAVREALAEKERIDQQNDDAGLKATNELSGQLGVEKTSAIQEREIVQLMFTQLLDKLEEQVPPLSLEYTYGPHGKPYLKNYPYYFSISHSGDYVFCVLSEQEVGADIQQKAPAVSERVLQRFFAPEEKEYWEQCGTDAEKRNFFYKMWCRKEAYGKLTGEGISDAVSVNMCDLEGESDNILWEIEEYSCTDDYQVAICKWKTHNV